MNRVFVCAVLAAACAAGYVFAQDGSTKHSGLDAATRARLAKVRREVKRIDFEPTLQRIPALLNREKEYRALLVKIHDAATGGSGDVKKLLEQGRQMKIAALKDLNEILKLHRGKYAGLQEAEVRRRLANTELNDVHYRDEWLVNILDDLEAKVGINIEIDARVYKYDTVSFDFAHTTAQAMLQTMADNLQFKWIIRGDTLYVYKERYEVLFDARWLAEMRAAQKAKELARRKALDAKRAAEEKKKAEDNSGSDDGGKDGTSGQGSGAGQDGGK